MASSQATSHIHQLLDEHWTATLHVAPSVWRDADVVVASHPEPSHTDLVYLIRREDSCIIVVPQTLVGSTTTACAAWPSAAVFDRAFVRSLYGAAIAGIYGPFWPALEHNSVAQCRVLDENRAAVRIARTLGFVEDGRTLEVVLHVPPRGDAFDG